MAVNGVPVEVERFCESAGIQLGEQVPEGWGYCLALFSFGSPGGMTFLSNISRRSLPAGLRELADRLEKNPPPPNGGSGPS